MKMSLITIVLFTLTTSTVAVGDVNADAIDDALREAYQRGYNDGYFAGKNVGGGGGGSQGHRVGIDVPSRSGGSTSGYEVPWAYKLDNSKNTIELLKEGKPFNPDTQRRSSRSIQQMKDQFNANKSIKSTIIIEGMPMKDFDKLDNLLKKTKSGDIWVAPSIK